jgi:glutathionyl-hydroquinone reductase
MGMLVEGTWRDAWYDTATTGGRFVREDARFRNWVTADGRPGPTGEGGHPAEAGRYHLYVSLACPWAHRTLIMRQLKGLGELVDISVVSPLMLDQGWTFERAEGSSGDRVGDRSCLHQVYTRARRDYSGRVTVPVLWDTERDTIVNNESAEIIRMFNTAFDHLTGNRDDYYPEALREEIEHWNARIYPRINNGVYRAGFATTQDAYAQAYADLFAELDALEEHLGRQRFLAGDQLTEADIRLFTTLIRFDAVYHGHFKCNRQRLEDFPQLSAYLRDIYQWPGIAPTVDFDHIKTHYYGSHRNINPTGIVPVGPAIDYRRPHGRG